MENKEKIIAIIKNTEWIEKIFSISHFNAIIIFKIWMEMREKGERDLETNLNERKQVITSFAKAPSLSHAII
jgi:hypothetical protein